MVAQLILVQFVGVQIPAGLPSLELVEFLHFFG